MDNQSRNIIGGRGFQKNKKEEKEEEEEGNGRYKYIPLKEDSAIKFELMTTKYIGTQMLKRTTIFLNHSMKIKIGIVLNK